MRLSFLEALIYLFISEHELLVLLELETLTDEVHKQKRLIQCMLQML